MKLRVSTILLSFAVSLALLATIAFVYDRLSLQRPLQEWLMQNANVRVVSLDTGFRRVDLQVELTPDQDLADFHQQLLQRVGSARLTLHLMDNPSEEMERQWEKSLFTLEQAIRRDEYALIPPEMERRKKDFEVVSAQLRQQYLYIRWAEGENQLLRILPTVREEEVIP